MIDVDWHCHSTWSDGQGTLAGMARQAAARGVRLGISDHILRDNRRLRTPEQLESYRLDVRAHGLYAGVELSVGEAAVETELDAFDYIIASLHVVNLPEGPVSAVRYLNWRAGIYSSYSPQLPHVDRRRYFDAWLTQLEGTARCWPVTILGHFSLLPDHAKEDGSYVLGDEPEPDETAAAWLDATIGLCRRHDIAIELNSKSRVPSPGFVQRAFDLGASFSLGSDAHHLRRAGDLSYGRQLVRQLQIPAERILAAPESESEPTRGPLPVEGPVRYLQIRPPAEAYKAAHRPTRRKTDTDREDGTMAIAAGDTQTTLQVEGLRTTRYSDVCGTDELKRLLLEEPELAASPEGRAALRGLLDDGLYMLARMEVRLREYQAFRDVLARLVAQMQSIEEPRLADAAAEATALRPILAQGSLTPELVQEVVRRAEEIRQVANDMEGALRRHKEGAIEASQAYTSLRGARGWVDGAAQSAPSASADADAGAGLPGVPEAWLPPSPHRELIVDWLRRGRAVILSAEEAARFPEGPQGREPLVQFEDGGVMPLRVVRWSEGVQNFHPLGTTPNPRNRIYRHRNDASEDASEGAGRA